ncbi:MAG: hypothetical protein ACTJII_08305 [Lactococcus lactis]|nr:hypothetical protein [Lactococcus lactis]
MMMYVYWNHILILNGVVRESTKASSSRFVTFSISFKVISLMLAWFVM